MEQQGEQVDWLQLRPALMSHEATDDQRFWLESDTFLKINSYKQRIIMPLADGAPSPQSAAHPCHLLQICILQA